MKRLSHLVVTPILAATVQFALSSEMPEVVVTATRTAEERLNIPANISVIDRDTIENSAARNVDDLLRGLSGVYVLRSVGMGYGIPSQVNVRGVPGQNAILMLADGIPLNESLTGYVGLNEIPIDAVDRIEVVRGPFSSLYGADAFAGVVNVISSDPEDLPRVQVRGKAGNEGFRSYSARGSGGTGDLGYSVTVESRSIDNYLARDRVIEQQTDPASGQSFDVTRSADNYDYEDVRALATFTAVLDEDTRLVVHARHFAGDLGYGVRDVRPLFPETVDNTMETMSSVLGATLRSEIGPGLTARSRVYVRRQERKLHGLDLAGMDTTGNPIFARSRSDAEGCDWFMDAGADVEWREGHTLSVGADFLESRSDFSPLRFEDTGERFPTSDGKTADIDNIGTYIQDQIEMSRDVRLVVGMRMDEHSEFGMAFSPRAGILRNLSPDTTVRASVGRAYRAPTLSELFQPSVHFGNVIFDSNPDLDPEYILSADAGVEHRFTESLSANLDVFYNDMDDLIGKTVSGSSLSYANTDEAWSAGIEAGLDWRVLPGVKVHTRYTGQQTENRATQRDLEHMANHMLSTGLLLSKRFQDWALGLSADGHYIGERGYVDFSTGKWQDLDDYWRMDAAVRLGYRDIAWIGFTVDNATDEVYREWPLINPAPGRLYAFELGLKYW